ncbi:hypothetical protein HPB47_004649 [Ixodes persulcatus]|uniref:Uncharacterized protein n=1 Tax=Ixodes persulcatus TaxID=34615 RepID=A0AC60PGE2_IXOPE|nr:hypothetical protein HPB47_004649 [Ixodes persulcatus]
MQQTIRSLFKTRRVALQPGELAALHERIRALSGSKAGPFIYDSYKRELEVCFTALRHKLCQQPRDQLLGRPGRRMGQPLHTRTAHARLDLGKGSESIRQTFLVTFRDVVVTKLDLDDLLSLNKDAVLESIRHMILILYNVSDSYPPTKTKLKLESLLARLVSPFLGFQGLYLQGHPEPVIESSEPEIAARRKSAGVETRNTRVPYFPPCYEGGETVACYEGGEWDRWR